MKKGQLDFAVEAIDVVKLDIADRADGLLAGHDLLSPYVWQAEGRIRLLVRVLKNPLGPTDPTGVIYAGQSDDGLGFVMDRTPAILPGPEFVDAGGVEDPTVVIGSEPHLMVFYTGVEGKREQGSLLMTTGPDLKHLTKKGGAAASARGRGQYQGGDRRPGDRWPLADVLRIRARQCLAHRPGAGRLARGPVGGGRRSVHGP